MIIMCKIWPIIYSILDSMIAMLDYKFVIDN